jgi:hypothetical protein
VAGLRPVVVVATRIGEGASLMNGVERFVESVVHRADRRRGWRRGPHQDRAPVTGQSPPPAAA